MLVMNDSEKPKANRTTWELGRLLSRSSFHILNELSKRLAPRKQLPWMLQALRAARVLAYALDEYDQMVVADRLAKELGRPVRLGRSWGFPEKKPWQPPGVYIQSIMS